MARHGVNGFARSLVGIALAVALLVAGAIGYRAWVDRYTVSTNDSGVAVARVVAAKLYGSSDLRVSRLTGIVQATGSTSRMWNWLNSTRVVKAPFEVNYFVDLGALGTRDFRYDAEARVLRVLVPDVVVGRPDIDEARVTVDETSGIYVSRSAMAELQRKVSLTAQRVATAKARDPENMRKARANGRAALERLFAGTLEAAGLPVTVEVRFAGEDGPRDAARWDVSRSLEEVLGNAQ